MHALSVHQLIFPYYGVSLGPGLWQIILGKPQIDGMRRVADFLPFLMLTLIV